MIYNRNTLVGLDNVKKHVEEECSKALVYKKSGRTPKCIIAHLSKGQGRTTLLNWIALEYKKSKVLGFRNGLDDYVEVDFSGDYDDYMMKKTIIEDASIFGNFDGLIGVSASELCKHKTERHWNDFIELIKEVSQKACIVFFVPYICKKADEELIKTIKEILGSQVIEMFCENYTTDEYLSIIIAKLKNSNVHIDNESELVKHIKANIKGEKLESIEDATKVIEELFCYVTCEKNNLILKSAQIKQIDLNMGGKKQ